jgi:hypothetical protein
MSIRFQHEPGIHCEFFPFDSVRYQYKLASKQHADRTPMVSCQRAGTRGVHFDVLSVLSVLGNVEHEDDVLFLLDVPVVAGKNDSRTFRCRGGSLQAGKPDASDDQAL